jgi:putative endonuclease
MRQFRRLCVYILASARNGTMYVGVTSDLLQRVAQHRSGILGGFTREYGVHRLVYAEFHASMLEAITRERRIQRWRRVWKLALIERDNLAWCDLLAMWSGGPGPPLSRG